MAFVAVSKDGSEWIHVKKPIRYFDKYWINNEITHLQLPKGSIKKLIGRELNWSDEPVELKVDENN